MASQLRSVALATLTLASLAAPATASSLFAKAELDPNKIVAIASPYAGGTAHQLLIVKQISNSRACWSEQQDGAITTINPLLTQFDFTGVCGRSIDSNGYSIRMGDEDLGWKYRLQVVRRGGRMLLVGAPTTDKRLPELQIGQVNGVTNGFAKINFNPGWRLTERQYNGQALGHIYVTNNQSLNSAIAVAPTLPPVTPPVVKPPIVTPPVVTPPVVKPPVVTPPVGTKPPINIPVPKPGTTTPPVATKPPTTLPTPPVVPKPPTTTPTRPTNPGNFVVPTVDIFR